MKKTAKVTLIVVFAVVCVIAIIFVIASFSHQTPSSSSVSDVTSRAETMEITTPAVTTIPQVTEMSAPETTSAPVSEPVMTETTVLIDDSAFINDILFPDDVSKDAATSDSYGLNDKLAEFDENAISLTFDGIRFRAGITISDIQASSDWYIADAGKLVQAGESVFVCLENKRWSDESLKITSKTVTRNGDVFVWVHNYTDTEQPVETCPVYKFQISYQSCLNYYSAKPSLSYLGYTFDSTTLETGDSPMSTEQICDANRHMYERNVFGENSCCKVFIDFDSSSKKLSGVTIDYSSAYGPDFTERR